MKSTEVSKVRSGPNPRYVDAHRICPAINTITVKITRHPGATV